MSKKFDFHLKENTKSNEQLYYVNIFIRYTLDL